jgi:phosphohistidine phosphatase
MSGLQLALIRHAKAVRAESGEPDFPRDLTGKGRRVASAMGEFLAGRADFRPHVVVTSPAARALATAERIAEPLGIADDRLVQNRRIYEATPGDLAGIVHGFSPQWKFATLVGHNPGLSDFADWLLGQATIQDMPTGAVVWLELDTPAWTGVMPGVARIQNYWTPRKLDLA